MNIYQVKYRVCLRLARFFASRIEMVPVQEKFIRKICSWRLCMSYNDSYFGEKPGLLKGLVAEIDSQLPPLKPLTAAQTEGRTWAHRNERRRRRY